MDCNWRLGLGIRAMCVPLMAIVMTALSSGRELRPSEHGLGFQNESAARNTTSETEMLNFFGGPTSSSVAEPRAMNWSEPAWSNWGGVGGGGGIGKGKKKKDHVKEVLLVASLACGIAGFSFLVAAAFIFLFRFQRKRSRRSSQPSSQSPPSMALTVTSK